MLISTWAVWSSSPESINPYLFNVSEAIDMDLATIWVRHKRPITIAAANVLGLMVILLVVTLMRTGIVISKPPDPAKASERKVAKYMASPKLARLPKNQRRQYLMKVTRYYDQSQRRARFSREVDRLSDFELRQLRDNVFEVAKEQAVEDSQVYNSLPPQQRGDFIDKKLSEVLNLETMIRGNNPNTDPTRIARLTKTVPTDPGGAYSMFLTKTNPQERTKIQTYVTAMQDRNEQLRAREKFQQQK